MNTSDSKERVQEILDFITEITLGSYTYTLPLRNHKDELEQIALSLNTMVEEIDTTVHQINHEKSKEVIENIVFHLDEAFIITSYSQNLTEILQYSKDELIGQPLNVILSPETSLPGNFDQLIKNGMEKNLPFQVELRHHSGYYWSGYGYLHRFSLNGKKSFTLSVFKAVYFNEKLFNTLKDQESGTLKYPSEYRSLLLQDQRKLLRELHKYIMERLDRKLQPLPKIAQEVGGSRSKIKEMFKNAYGETIHTYQRRKRLEKAFLLIRDTKLPINEIIEECGFKSFSHFSRSFKKEYGIPPSKIRKS